MVVPMTHFIGNHIFIFTDPNAHSHICTDSSVVRETAERAKSRPIGFTLSAHGPNGQPGAHGTEGSKGFDGSSGSSSQKGSHGGKGGKGISGNPGSSGSRGGEVYLILSGSADELYVGGSTDFKAKLGGIRYEVIMLVDCHGGDSGDGGMGGRGGHGGRGGKGGNGAKGSNGFSNGSDGGNGGDGGDGDDGGDGGEGGDGGNGGDAGEGGKCVIETVDPRLLMWIVWEESLVMVLKVVEVGKVDQGEVVEKEGLAVNPVLHKSIDDMERILYIILMEILDALEEVGCVGEWVMKGRMEEKELVLKMVAYSGL